MRNARIIRKTAETDIMLTLDLDGNGVSQIKFAVGGEEGQHVVEKADSCLDLAFAGTVQV